MTEMLHSLKVSLRRIMGAKPITFRDSSGGVWSAFIDDSVYLEIENSACGGFWTTCQDYNSVKSMKAEHMAFFGNKFNKV